MFACCKIRWILFKRPKWLKCSNFFVHSKWEKWDFRCESIDWNWSKVVHSTAFYVATCASTPFEGKRNSKRKKLSNAIFHFLIKWLSTLTWLYSRYSSDVLALTYIYIGLSFIFEFCRFFFHLCNLSTFIHFFALPVFIWFFSVRREKVRPIMLELHRRCPVACIVIATKTLSVSFVRCKYVAK